MLGIVYEQRTTSGNNYHDLSLNGARCLKIAAGVLHGGETFPDLLLCGLSRQVISLHKVCTCDTSLYGTVGNNWQGEKG